MNTRILMMATVLYLGIVGLSMTFLPQEIAEFFDSGTNQTLILVLQVLGALYLGFAMMNWMARNSLIGGIYNRPLVFGNLLHFLVSAFALVKAASKYDENQFIAIISVSILYLIFAISFGYSLKTSPIKSADVD